MTIKLLATIMLTFLLSGCSVKDTIDVPRYACTDTPTGNKSEEQYCLPLGNNPCGIVEVEVKYEVITRCEYKRYR